ncbi:MAG TPA: hypothetical protein VNS22_28070 [Geminicoccus sp.]|uniref:hypothetical protein n=1 Tax=Geminicoccus sp. TaxID=2024832 RepID=UPI002CF8D4C4|nr:hypothetical protein [Geminicoccus sp.]HWL72216.1 hypothetical protein [Geminicoccus sp.]
MTTEIKARASLRQRALHEFREFLFLSAYLYVTLGAVILMQTATLHAQGMDITPWGSAVVKALVLAKFMLAGRAIGIGERAMHGPLIWPTLHKTFAFLVLLIVLTLVEEAVVGLFHGRSIAASLGELAGPRLLETIAGIVIMLLVLFPYFALRVLNEALGDGTLARMFLGTRAPASAPER